MGLLLGLVVIVLTIMEPAWYGWLIAVVLLSSAARRPKGRRVSAVARARSPVSTARKPAEVGKPG